MYPGRKTAADTTRKLVHRFYDQFWNARRYDPAARLLGPNAVFRGTLGTAEPGPHGLEAYAYAFSEAFGDLHMEMREVIVDRDRAAAHIRLTGTHRGHIFDCPPSGRAVQHDCVTLFRTAHGRIVEIDVHGDRQALTQQMTI
jgi:predicted ester cyclase